MNLEPFALERYFAKYEFSVPHLLSSSDCDGWPMSEILGLADPKLWNGRATRKSRCSCGVESSGALTPMLQWTSEPIP
jgi:hypothetical protein